MPIIHGERSVPYYGTSVLLLFFALSVSSYDSDSQSKNFLVRSSHRRKNTSDGGRGGRNYTERVTELFNPILPLTCGMKSRRLRDDGNWRRCWRNWFGLQIITTGRPPMDSSRPEYQTSQSSWVNSQTISSLVPRGGRRDDTHQNAASKSRKKRVKQTHATATTSLSTNDPFISTDKISEMTLDDIALVFRYVIESGRDSFDSKKFLSQRCRDGLPLKRWMIDTMQAIDQAVSKSRGKGILPARTSQIQFDLTVDANNHAAPLSPKIGYGDVDALQFCAAMRLFAEWRLLRQVPSGYKTYADGMNRGYKDICQNVAKIEHAVHEWIQSTDADVEMHDGSAAREGAIARTTDIIVRRSPTLRQLLLHEIDTDTHTTSSGKLPRLKDGTAAMGLLWVRRQLQYQTILFRNVLSVTEECPSAKKAIRAAYCEVYDGIHGWAVQKVFNYSFKAAPAAEEIFRHMNPEELSRVRIAAVEGGGLDDTVDIVGGRTLQQSLESGNDKSDCSHPSLEEDRKDYNQKQIVKVSLKSRRRTQQNRPALCGELLEKFIDERMTIDARQQTTTFLLVAKPLLADLAGLFAEMNMDDPTKV